MKIVSRDELNAEFKQSIDSGIKHSLPSSALVGSYEHKGLLTVTGSEQDIFNMMSSAQRTLAPVTHTMASYSRNGFELPVGEEGKSVYERIINGQFAAGTQSLTDNWQDIWEANIIDITRQRELHQTVRQFIYTINSKPDATKVMRLRDLLPYAIRFKENTGNGDPVPLGTRRYFQEDTVEFKIFAAGYKLTLLNELFDTFFRWQEVNRAVAHAYALKRDDDAIRPILEHVYDAVHTHDGTTAIGTERQEKLHAAIMDGIDAFGELKHPLDENNNIDVNRLVLLANPADARHIRMVASGLPSVNERRLTAITDIDMILEYPGTTVQFPEGIETYPGVPKGTVFMISRNELMQIWVKRDLSVESEARPSVLTLGREERAWFYSEAIYNEGISSFVMKLILPEW